MAYIQDTYLCERFVEAISPELKNFELDNGTIIPMIRNPGTYAPAVRSAKDPKTEPMVTRSPHVRAAEKREVPAHVHNYG